MPNIVIIADDLSGAADCGIVCANAGVLSAVSLDPIGRVGEPVIRA